MVIVLVSRTGRHADPDLRPAFPYTHPSRRSKGNLIAENRVSRSCRNGCRKSAKSLTTAPGYSFVYRLQLPHMNDMQLRFPVAVHLRYTGMKMIEAKENSLFGR